MSFLTKSPTEGPQPYCAWEQAECSLLGRISAQLTVGISWTSLVLVTWGILTAAGALLHLSYGQTPGVITEAPEKWPDSSFLETDPTRWTLVMTAHPKCPCTAASIYELRELIAWSETPLTTHLVFLSGPEGASSWFAGRTVDIARASTDIQLHFDQANLEVGRFAATTSGHVLLYDTVGRLRYSGGITASRGHRGANRGSGTILSLLSDRASTDSPLPVYGCELFDEVEPANKLDPLRGEPRDD